MYQRQENFTEGGIDRLLQAYYRGSLDVLFQVLSSAKRYRVFYHGETDREVLPSLVPGILLKLAADEDRLRDKWGPRSHPAPTYGINVSPRVFVYGAPDEWLWHTELAQLNATVQAPGLTNVYWSYSCQHADNRDGASPCAYLDKV